MKTHRVLAILVVSALGVSVCQRLPAQLSAQQAYLPASHLPALNSRPEFPGGSDALSTFINDHLEYPEKARYNGVEGEVWAEFTVSADGRISKSRITKGLGFGCDGEVLRLIEEMPRWNPALKDGKRISTEVRLPFSFQLRHGS